jgi:DNA invertase Pin-like site-specific DNA recombinase
LSAGIWTGSEAACFQQQQFFYSNSVDSRQEASYSVLVTTKCFAYLRVSGKGQIAGDGFTRQLDSITRYAKTNDVNIVNVFRDGGIAGTKELTERPAFTEMLAALHANGIRLILIEKLDRLARNLPVQESIIAELKKHGFELISVEEPDLLKDDPYRVMFRQFQGAISQAEKTNIVLKLKGARQRMKARTGRCEGRKPFGDRVGEMTLVERMTGLRAAGMGYDRIAGTLNAEGVPTRTPGKRWHGFAVNQILSRGTR